MTRFAPVCTFTLLIALAALLRPGLTTDVHAQENTPAVTDRPFRLPFAEPSGPDTWLMAQPYGNTTGAYYQRRTTYGASGGIHFGVDLSAPCGTEILAVADGVVFAVDGPFGSPPHNLMIDHPQLGYASMYGHLLAPPNLQPGDMVKAGQVVANVGDSGGDCNRYPHLHLEIRDLNHFKKFNPHALVDADWDQLALISSGPRSFMKDLNAPRKWQSLYQQPIVQTGGPIVNDFTETWPLDWNASPGGADPEPAELSPPPVLTPTAQINLPSGVRQLTEANCCAGFNFSYDGSQIRFVDRPVADEPAGVWGVNVSGTPSPQLIAERLGHYSRNEQYVAYPDRTTGTAIVERRDDGQQWTVETDGSRVYFTPDSTRILWEKYDSEVPWRSRAAELWLADVDGSNASRLATIRRGGPAAWLGERALLITSRVPPSQDTKLARLSLDDGSLTDIAQVPRLRGAALSPDDRHLVYMVRFDTNPEKNGLWLLDLEADDPEPQPLPFFGSYRWRDNDRLIYIPFAAETEPHVFYEYNITTGESKQLFPRQGQELGLRIANNEWEVSPDGSQIALLAANGANLNGIWLIDLPN